MTTVLIWNNKMYHGPGGHEYSGHAAMSIDDDWRQLGQQASYVSWWPEKDSEGHNTGFSKPKMSVSDDFAAEGYAPDHIIKIAGLDTRAMMGKWQDTKNKPNSSYKFYRKNCSTIVGRVLSEGSSKGGLSRVNLIWTPLKVKRLALAMGGTTKTWHEFLKELVVSGYLSAGDGKALDTLGKRDERHGSSGAKCYFAKGKQIAPKTFIAWTAGGKSGGHQIGGKHKDNGYFWASEGSIMSQHTRRANGDGWDELHEVTINRFN